jgi:protein-S-isoprenylcysteine O-methyltransferase Ste14
MRKALAIIGSTLFFIAVPGFLAGVLPWWIWGWDLEPAFFGLPLLRAVGVLLIALGLIPLIDSFRRFAVEGLGTPAPIAPPERLIVTGFYRYVRNPMYVGVVAAVLGQSLLFGNAALFAYGAAGWLFFHAFVTLHEEPTLRRRFGAEYETYCRNVPRWIPRLRPWRPPSERTQRA